MLAKAMTKGKRLTLKSVREKTFPEFEIKTGKISKSEANKNSQATSTEKINGCTFNKFDKLSDRQLSDLSRCAAGLLQFNYEIGDNSRTFKEQEKKLLKKCSDNIYDTLNLSDPPSSKFKNLINFNKANIKMNPRMFKITENISAEMDVGDSLPVINGKNVIIEEESQQIDLEDLSSRSPGVCLENKVKVSVTRRSGKSKIPDICTENNENSLPQRSYSYLLDKKKTNYTISIKDKKTEGESGGGLSICNCTNNEISQTSEINSTRRFTKNYSLLSSLNIPPKKKMTKALKANDEKEKKTDDNAHKDTKEFQAEKIMSLGSCFNLYNIPPGPLNTMKKKTRKMPIGILPYEIARRKTATLSVGMYNTSVYLHRNASSLLRATTAHSTGCPLNIYFNKSKGYSCPPNSPVPDLNQILEYIP